MRFYAHGVSANPIVFVLLMPFYLVVLFFGGLMRLLTPGPRR